MVKFDPWVAYTVDCDLEQEHMTHPVTNRSVHLLTHSLSHFFNLNLPRGGLQFHKHSPQFILQLYRQKQQGNPKVLSRTYSVSNMFYMHFNIYRYKVYLMWNVLFTTEKEKTDRK